MVRLLASPSSCAAGEWKMEADKSAGAQSPSWWWQPPRAPPLAQPPPIVRPCAFLIVCALVAFTACLSKHCTLAQLDCAQHWDEWAGYGCHKLCMSDWSLINGNRSMPVTCGCFLNNNRAEWERSCRKVIYMAQNLSLLSSPSDSEMFLLFILMSWLYEEWLKDSCIGSCIGSGLWFMYETSYIRHLSRPRARFQ